jgi:hypothetical protein
MFQLIEFDFSQKSPHFSLLSPTSPSNLKVVGALDNYSLVFVIFIKFSGQLKDWVGQVLFLVSCPKGQVEKYVSVEAWHIKSNQINLYIVLVTSKYMYCIQAETYMYM